MSSDSENAAPQGKSWTRRLVRVGAILTVIAALICAGIAGYGWFEFNRAGPPAKGLASETVVLLDEGMGLNSIATRLEEAGVIRNRFVFRAGVLFSGNGKRLKAGEYSIPARAPMDDVMRLLVEGKSILHKLTVPEGKTVAMIWRIVEEDPILVGDMPAVMPPEGELLPETYLFMRGTSRAELLERMHADHSDLLDQLWEGRKEGLPIASKDEAVTLASIVEKETGLAEERPRVAAVFVNRLRRGMKLQSDPTIIYGLTKGEPLGRGIRKSELERRTPYNTYIIDGLPPTPIANPGRAALEAVLNPPDTEELYFVADGTGGHVFAKTVSEHNRNVAAWRRIERERRAEAN